MKFSKRLKRGVTYRFARFAMWFLNAIPRQLAVFFGAALGLAAWLALPRDRYRIERHLGLVYPDSLGAEERQLVGRSFFVNSGKNLAEVVRLEKHYRDEVHPLIEVEGLEHFDRAYRSGTGLIGITGHLGNFELLAVHIVSLGYEVAAIGREMYDRRMDELLVRNRAALGVANIATTDSPRKALSWLKKGKALGVLIDIDSIRVRSTFVPALGRMALTPIGQTMLGLKTGAAFIPMACLRTPGNRYKLIIRPEVRIERSDDFDDDVRRMTAACTAVLDEIIHEHKDQWIWMKNRWLTSPENYA